MKKSALALPAVLAIVLSLGGCFGGEDAKDNPVDPQDTSKASNTKKLSPGLYVGDYAPFDTTEGLESEFTLASDGSYRFYWIYTNEAFGDIRGSWFQRDSNLHFSDVKESYNEGGIFYPGVEIEDDTNSIREITENSFLRKEWTPLRQKPYWITYRKKSFNGLANGTFQFSREFQVDSNTFSTVRINISLDGKGFLYDYLESYSGDTMQAFQAKAKWYQVGSIFVTEQNEGRNFDTATHAFSAAWDTIPGALLQRVKDVSDSAFLMWSPGSIFSVGSWDVYKKN